MILMFPNALLHHACSDTSYKSVHAYQYKILIHFKMRTGSLEGRNLTLVWFGRNLTQLYLWHYININQLHIT